MGQEWVGSLLLMVAAFVLGSIPFAYLAGRLRGIDIRQHGSGNVGATNAFRVLGAPLGALVLLCDASKGALAAWWGLAQGELIAVLMGLAAILGHTFSPFMRFKGGKGVASAAGVFLLLAPDVMGVTVVLFLASVLLTRYVSVGSMLASVTLPALMVWWDKPFPYQIVAVVTGAFVFYRHIPNLQRLLAGQENPIRRK
ncbi:glycerol-3-phosphate 1-O-acyltransferase PlsY [Heliophilum fasciatum]|nr:glycerol-3-phosphate 1-O-acyltransferase PlsY [Heliophilum fasciatum]